jgi:hypothetical protein
MGYIKQFYKRATSPRYIYSGNRFKETFLENELIEMGPSKPLIRRIFCFWTGSNEMNLNRLSSIDSLRKTAGIEIVLITKDNLTDYILDKYPLHKGFEYLSAVHKSDYLRCYFMHHYGGGYSDVKSCRCNWTSSFELLEKNPEKWILGYREVGKRGVAQVENREIRVDLIENWHILIGNGAYICRANTPFTAQWYSELHRRMDHYFDELVKNPGNIMGDNEGYPIPWTRILGEIFHPLCLKYNQKIIFSNCVKPILKKYR